MPWKKVEQGARGRVRPRAHRRAVRRLRARGVRGGLDRTGPPRDADRRAPRGGEDPVPGRRRGARGRPAQHGDDRAPREGDRAGARPEGDRQGAARACARGARLRVRGPEPARLRARLPRPPVHLRAARDQPAVAAPRARHRVRRGARLRGRQAASQARSATASARSSFASASARSTTCSTSTPTPTRATTS